jgi:hypothetical protein
VATRQPCQVLVVGAGAAGALAAIAAARSGADTVLLEQDDGPGGFGRSQFHRHICGWFASGTEEPGPIIHGPLVQELCDRLRRRSPSTRPLRMGRVWVWPLEAGQWSEALSDWLRETCALRFLVRQRVTAFAPDDEGAGLVRTSGEDGELDLAASMIVDASGSATVAALAGWDPEQTDAADRQLAGCTLRLAGVDADDALLPFRVPDCLRRAAEHGLLPAVVRHATFIPAGGGFSLLRLNLPAETPQRQVAALAQAALAELREHCEAFRAATLDETSALAPRDGPRVRGRYRLTGEDVVTARRFDDAVARGAWPSERWSQDRGPRYRYVPAGACYDIPLRSLLSPRSDRVLFAGRSLSADDEAAASVRVMGICMATGEAAGREAARRAS